MSGHSKWSTIKRKKGANDAARGKEFTKIAKLITLAAQNGGGDASMNPSLTLAIDKARSVNMPNDNIQRAIKRGTGEGGAGGRLEEISYEGYAPHNVAIIIECTTDNKNRTVADLRSMIEKNGGRLGESGSVSWQFITVGRILLEFETEQEKTIRENAKWNDTAEKYKLQKNTAENFQLELLEIEGILDIIADDFGLEIKTEYSSLNTVRQSIDAKNILIAESSLVKESTSPIELTESQQERVDSFIETIEEYDDVQKIWNNIA